MSNRYQFAILCGILLVLNQFPYTNSHAPRSQRNDDVVVFVEDDIEEKNNILEKAKEIDAIIDMVQPFKKQNTIIFVDEDILLSRNEIDLNDDNRHQPVNFEADPTNGRRKTSDESLRRTNTTELINKSTQNKQPIRTVQSDEIIFPDTAKNIVNYRNRKPSNFN